MFYYSTAAPLSLSYLRIKAVLSNSIDPAGLFYPA